MLLDNEINPLSKDDEILIESALEDNQEALARFLYLFQYVFTPQEKKYIKASFDKAYQAKPNNPHYLFLQGLMQQIGMDSPPNYTHAADLYRQAMIYRNGKCFNNIATLIVEGHYSPCAEDFAAAGITDPGGDRYQQAAAFYRQAMRHKEGISFCNIASTIASGHYSPSAEDFATAGITGDEIKIADNNRSQQAAAFLRQAMIYKIDTSFYHIAKMIEANSHSPGAEDFAAAGITEDEIQKAGNDRYGQAAAFYRQAIRHKVGTGINSHSIGKMIDDGDYAPVNEDFIAAGMTEVEIKNAGNNRYQQAAAFYRHSMKYKFRLSFHDIAAMIYFGDYSPCESDSAAAGITDNEIKLAGNNRYQQAAAFLRRAMKYKVGGSIYQVGFMISKGQYSPGESDFTAAGITDNEIKIAGSNPHQQAAAFYRRAMVDRISASFRAIALMIAKGFYSPCAEDFISAGIPEDDIKSAGSNQSQQVALFLRQAISYNLGESVADLAAMISKGYVPCAKDFSAAGIIDPGGDCFNQSAAFHYHAYLTYPNLRETVVSMLEKMLLYPLNKNGHTHLVLLRIYLLHDDLKRANEYFEGHPDKNKVLEILITELVAQLDIPNLAMQRLQTLFDFISGHGVKNKALEGLIVKVVEQLDNPKLRIERKQTLIDFIMEQGARELNPLVVNYVELKALLLDEEDKEALDYYRKNIPSYFALTSQEYFRLGSVAIGSVLPTMSDEQSDQLRDEGFNFLYKSYQLNKEGKDDTKRLIIKMLLEKKGVRIDCGGKEAEQKFQEFLAEITKREESNSQSIKHLLTSFENIRSLRTKLLSFTASEDGTPSFFSKNEKPITHPELVFIDTVISHIKNGHSLTEQRKDPEIQTGLTNYPLLAELINEEMKIIFTRIESSSPIV